MCDDQDTHLRTRQLLQTFTDDPNCIAVETAVGFIEDRELRLQHRQLKNLHSFLFPTGEAFVQVASSELDIHSETFHLALQFLAEIAHRNQSLTLFASRVTDVCHGMAKEVSDFHTGDCHRVLEREKQTQTSSFARIK